jgi:hypothetical protein
LDAAGVSYIPVTRLVVAGGAWIHAGRWRRDKPVYRYFPERTRTA